MYKVWRYGAKHKRHSKSYVKQLQYGILLSQENPQNLLLDTDYWNKDSLLPMKATFFDFVKQCFVADVQ
jgi:hypothetical protein